MTAIYVREQGANVSRRGERLVISKDGVVINEVPMVKIDQLVLMGNVQLSTQAVASMLQREVDVVYLSSFGKYRGRLAGLGSKNVSLRQAQLRKMSHMADRLPIARQVVIGKVNNQRVLLQRQLKRKTRLDTPLFQRNLTGMKNMQASASRANSLDSLRGFEGKAGAYYFGALRTFLDTSWGFKKRDYYPPPDPFNALISFCYSLLLKDVTTAVQLVGLDPYLGFFHEISHGRPSLSLDLMEEWRPVLADATAFELINSGQLIPSDFNKTNNPRRPVELGEDGVKTVLSAYEKRLNSKAHHPLAGRGGQASLRYAIQLQARLLARVIQDKDTTYIPVETQ